MLTRLGHRCLLFVLLGTLVLAAPGPVLAAPLAAPVVSISPTSGPPGSAASVFASGFAPGFVAAVRWGGSSGVELWGSKNSTASFTANITIPADAKPGVYTIFVCNNCGGGEFEESALTQFEVTAAPASGPILQSFTADQTSLVLGQCTTLRWQAYNASSVYLTTPNGQEGVGGEDSRQACPTQTFTYILTVNSVPGGQPPSLQGKVTIVVTAKPTATSLPTATTAPSAIPAPIIRTFTADSTALTPGQCTLLHWTTLNTDSASLSDGKNSQAVKTNGEQQVCPTETTTFTLVAQGFKGAQPARASAQILIGLTPLPVSPTAPAVLGDFDFGPLVNPLTDPGLALRSLGYCSEVNLGIGARVIDFEDQAAGTSLTNQYSAQGVRFGPGTAFVDRPPMGTHSPSQAVHSPTDDFGSAFHPILMNFSTLMSAVGLYVGREAPAYPGESPATATLTAFGAGPGGHLVQIAEDAIFLPGSAVPIERCLIVRAPAGQGIRAVRLEYTDWDGISHTTRRWLDDLNLLPSSTTGGDLPPVVSIISPAAGASATTSGVLLQVRITEDIGLTGVSAQVNRGPWQSMLVSQDPSDPSHFTGYASLTGLRPFAGNEVTVVATDTNRNMTSASVTFNYQPSAGVDLILNRVEVTQAIQCLDNPTCPDNSVPLYVNKPTLVRAYVFLDRGPTTLANISGRLCRGDTGAVSCISPLRPLASVNLNQANNSIGALRNQLALTLNFLLPMDWVSSAGALDFTVYANYNGENAAECCNDNNRQRVRLSVRAGRTVDAVFIPVSANGFQPDINERWALADWLFRVYPVSRIGVWENADGVGNNYNFPDTSGSGCGDGWGGLLDDLWWFNAWREDGVGWLRYYGMVDRRSTMGSTYAGCGYRPGDESAGIVSPGNRNGSEIAAQEVGHNHGRMHAPSGTAANTDPRYPNPDGLLDEWGVDVGRMQLYPPTSTFDYMGYGGSEGNTWTSAYTYRAMASAIQSVAYLPGSGVLARPARLQEAEAEFFMGGGFISPTAVEVRQGFYRATLPVTANDGLISGPYTVQMLDAAGQQLYARGFSLPELSNSEPEAGGPFQVILPWKDGTTMVVFKYNDAEVGRVTASPHAPEVRVTSPLGGEHWGAVEEQPVTWEGADADGDPLLYSVQYSPDKGATWVALGVNRTDTGLKLSTAHLPGGQAALVRVIASDGFNSTAATSAGTFSVDGHPPSVFIGSPDNGLTLTQGTPVVLHAYGTDTEDGALAAGAFNWQSSVDGALGGGDLIIADALSVGEHTINVTGQDAQGNTATYSVKLTVQPAPPETVTPDSGTITGRPQAWQIWAGIAIVVVGLALLGLGALIALRRRA